jgi:hypothetical protein
MAKITLDANRRVFANLKALIFTPWENETTLGSTDYDIVNIVADTTSLEQADNEVNAIDHEFSNEPLYENVNLGEKTFTAECIDFQNDVLKTMFGWTVDKNGNAFAPIVYKDLFCKIEMHFNSTDDIIVFPKVKLNSKAVIASMKTDVSRANLTGTCYSAWVNVENSSYDTDMALISKATGTSGYSVTSTALNTVAE